MPMHSGWLPREGTSCLPHKLVSNSNADSPGLTIDPIGRLIKNTILNPVVTLPFLLAVRYSKQGAGLSILHETAFSGIKYLFILGLLRLASKYLDAGVLNNWAKDNYDWTKEIVLVTGGAGGIGGEIVKLLAEREIKVIVLDVIPMTFKARTTLRPLLDNLSLIRTIAKYVYCYKCDITSPSAISAVAREIRRDVGEPTILINNAGVARGKSILDATEKDVRFTFDVNTLAHYFMAKEFVPSMVKRDHGMIVSVASAAAYLTAPGMVDYAASKVATLAFHEGLTAELVARYNAPRVRTVVVNQGYTKTPLFQGFKDGSQFIVPSLEPQTVAEAIVRQVLSGTSGQIIIPGIGGLFTLLRGFPHWVQIKMRAQGRDLMTNWNGRQVMDVEKRKKDKESE